MIFSMFILEAVVRTHHLPTVLTKSADGFCLTCFLEASLVKHHTNHPLHSHTLLFICLSKSTDCLYRHTFIHRSKVLISIWLKAFELLSTQLNFFHFFPFSTVVIFFSLFLQQCAGLVRSGSSTISLRCTLPSCCFAMIKELLDKWLGWTGSLVESNSSRTEAQSWMQMTVDWQRVNIILGLHDHYTQCLALHAIYVFFFILNYSYISQLLPYVKWEVAHGWSIYIKTQMELLIWAPFSAFPAKGNFCQFTVTVKHSETNLNFSFFS